MNKKVMIYLLTALMAFSVALAGEKTPPPKKAEQAVIKAAPVQVEKQSLSTDLGKGLSYPGLTAQEQSKISEQSNASKKPTVDAKPVKVSKVESKPNGAQGPERSTSNQMPSKGKQITTDLGKNSPYPGLSTQEENKLQGQEGK